MSNKLVYICSRYRADNEVQFKKQLSYTKEMARVQVLKGNDVIAPHLYYPSFLDDNNHSERNLGMYSAINLMNRCDVILVCVKFGVSSGMKAEIKHAESNNMKIIEVL